MYKPDNTAETMYNKNGIDKLRVDGFEEGDWSSTILLAWKLVYMFCMYIILP